MGRWPRPRGTRRVRGRSRRYGACRARAGSRIRRSPSIRGSTYKHLMVKRSYGTGRLYEKSDAHYGRWRIGAGRHLKRKVGGVRIPGEGGGPTRSQAEREFRPGVPATAPTAISCSLLHRPGSPLDRPTLSKRFKAACRDTAVREVKFHDTQHTFAARLTASGRPMRPIQEFLGHADSKTTPIYARYAPSKRDAQMVNEACAPDTDTRPLALGAMGDG